MVKGPQNWYILSAYVIFVHKLKMSSKFYCLSLTIWTPVDDFLWSYSQWFVSQLKVEAPPCLPSSPAKLLSDVSKCWELKSPLFHWETACTSVEETANPCGLLLHFKPPFLPYSPRKWRLLMARWADLCLWYVPLNLLVQPKRSLLALFKHGGPVRSFQVFSLWDVQQRQLREQIN